MTVADDLLFAPIEPKAGASQWYHINKLLSRDMVIDVCGYEVALGQSQSVIYFKVGDDVQIGDKKYVVVVEGTYDDAIVELVS